MTGQTSLPNIQYFNRMLRIIVPSIEDYMSQTSSNHGGNNQVYEQTFEPFQINIFTFEHLLNMTVSKKESQRKH